MREKTRVNREIIAQKIVDAVVDVIAEKGMSAVSARDIASRCGLTIGGLYLAVGNLEAAVSMANARTLEQIDARLVADVASARAERGSMTPLEVCQVLARGYAGFALENRPLWSALFAFDPQNADVLTLHRGSQGSLMGRIIGPLSMVRQDVGLEVLDRRARAFFGAVHGVVLMSMEDRYLGVEAPHLLDELDALVEALIKGFAKA